MLPRRLRISAPRQPALIFAVTDLLTAQGCTISKMEGRSELQDGDLRFLLDAIIKSPAESIDAITAELKVIVDANRGVKIYFGDASSDVNLMEHA